MKRAEKKKLLELLEAALGLLGRRRVTTAVDLVRTAARRLALDVAKRAKPRRRAP